MRLAMERKIISLEELDKKALEKEEENYKFRSFLKGHAKEKKLDRQFRMLHEKYFKNFDCSKCRNCCKKLGVSLQEDELNKICEYYNFNKEEIKNKYLKENYGEYINKKNPCPFLNSNNECRIKKSLPRTCKEYPYTNKEERLFSLLTIVNNSKICPIVYEILEDLKEIYGFRCR